MQFFQQSQLMHLYYSHKKLQWEMHAIIYEFSVYLITYVSGAISLVNDLISLNQCDINLYFRVEPVEVTHSDGSVHLYPVSKSQ